MLDSKPTHTDLPRGLTLDLDDTLWPIAPAIARAEAALEQWFASCAPRVLEMIDPPGLRGIRTTVFAAHPELAHDFSALRRLAIARMLELAGYATALADDAFEAFFAARHEVTLYDDVRPALERLASRFPIVALTNGNADIDRIGLGPYFVGTVFARDVGISKPHGAMFEAAATKLDLEPSWILHAGDHVEHDVEGALAAGFSAVWVNRSGASRESREDTVSCLGELADRLLAPGRREGPRA